MIVVTMGKMISRRAKGCEIWNSRVVRNIYMPWVHLICLGV